MSEPRRHRALITRPQEDAADIAIALARRGVTPVLAPMMKIVHAARQDAGDVDDEAGRAQAILFTSRNGVRAFSRLSTLRHIPAFAVGDSTAALARDLGFSWVESASGDSDDLVRLVRRTLRPEEGPLYHASGETVAGSLSEQLTEAGFTVTRHTLYRAEAIGEFSPDTKSALQRDTLDYVLFFSPRTARIFLDCLAESGLAAKTGRLVAICLSPAVTDVLELRAWRAVKTALEPTTDAMIRMVDKLEKNDSPLSALAAAVNLAAGTGTPAEPKSAEPAGGEPDKPVEPERESGENRDDGNVSAPAGPWQSAIEDAAAPEPETEAAPSGAVDEYPRRDTAEPEERAPGSSQEEPDAAAAETSGDDPEKTPGGGMTDRDEARDKAGDAPKTGSAPWGTDVSKSSETDRKQASEAAAAASSGPAPNADPPEGTDETGPSHTDSPETEPPREALPEFLAGGPGDAAPPRRRRWATVGWTLAAVLFVLVIAFATLPYWRDRLPETIRAQLGGDGNSAVASLQAEVQQARSAAEAANAALAETRRREADLVARLDALAQKLDGDTALSSRIASNEAAIESLRGGGSGSGESSAAVAALVDRLTRVETALEAAQQARADATQDARQSERLRIEQQEKTSTLVDRMESRIAALETQLKDARRTAAAAGHADSVALAVAQLRDALSRPAPFAAEVATLRKVAGDEPEIKEAIDPVLPYAERGIPTQAGLFARLPQTVDAAVRASRPQEDGDILGRVVSKFRDFVTVRRVDGKGAAAEDRIARAEMAAGRDDLAQAVEELSGLDGPAAEAVAPWVGDARARLAAESASAALSRALLTGVAQGPEGARPASPAGGE